MSTRQKGRRPLDQYMTPPHYVGVLLNEANIFGHVLEPCAGDLAIATPLAKLPSVRRVVTNDIDLALKTDWHLDAREPELYEMRAWDWIVTNPPFSDELPILEQALEHAPNVAFLARLSFLEPTEDRADLLFERGPDQVVVLPRYSFRLNDKGKKQTDNVTCCWMIWRKDHQPYRTRGYGNGMAQAMAILHDLNV